MKYVALLLVASMFVAMGAAQPEEPPEMKQALDENATNQSDVVDEVNESELENESEEVIPERDQDRARQGAGAQFDARLQTAISTLDTLVEIAPSEEAQTGIKDALTTLRDVQNSTDTASLGPEETPDQDRDRDRNQSSENRSGQRGPPEDAGPEGDKGPSERGPSENGNRPGFVEGLIGGIFG